MITVFDENAKALSIIETLPPCEAGKHYFPSKDPEDFSLCQCGSYFYIGAKQEQVNS